jgi:hypothetical protein
LVVPLFDCSVGWSVGHLAGCLFCKVLCSAGLSSYLADCSFVQSVVNWLVFPSVGLSVRFLNLLVKFLKSTLRCPHCLSCFTFQQSGWGGMVFYADYGISTSIYLKNTVKKSL